MGTPFLYVYWTAIGAAIAGLVALGAGALRGATAPGPRFDRAVRRVALWWAAGLALPLVVVSIVDREHVALALGLVVALAFAGLGWTLVSLARSPAAPRPLAWVALVAYGATVVAGATVPALVSARSEAGLLAFLPLLVLPPALFVVACDRRGGRVRGGLAASVFALPLLALLLAAIVGGDNVRSVLQVSADCVPGLEDACDPGAAARFRSER